MEYEMRAEYAGDASPREAGARFECWHMTRDHETTAMCGIDLDEAAATQTPDAWGTPEGQPFCHTCGALYLRQVI
ncbi:hypothetical protein GCM10009654_21850 [Streptomyces hebeiensis]|uniref:Uncharacterized protein n=1 Tax=Streptomyces hebeiensis TaxID=229486 RepID=A0ABN1URL4_9ACTN|nr:hypothetical protein [Streptomyces sp. NRRL F-5135]